MFAFLTAAAMHLSHYPQQNSHTPLPPLLQILHRVGRYGHTCTHIPGFYRLLLFFSTNDSLFIFLQSFLSRRRVCLTLCRATPSVAAMLTKTSSSGAHLCLSYAVDALEGIVQQAAAQSALIISVLLFNFIALPFDHHHSLVQLWVHVCCYN